MFSKYKEYKFIELTDKLFLAFIDKDKKELSDLMLELQFRINKQEGYKMIYDMDKQTGYTGTHTYWLRQRLEMVGHASLASWMLDQGYNFRYAYFVCFNRFPRESVRTNEH